MVVRLLQAVGSVPRQTRRSFLASDMGSSEAASMGLASEPTARARSISSTDSPSARKTLFAGCESGNSIASMAATATSVHYQPTDLDVNMDDVYISDESDDITINETTDPTDSTFGGEPPALAASKPVAGCPLARAAWDNVTPRVVPDNCSSIGPTASNPAVPPFLGSCSVPPGMQPLPSQPAVRNVTPKPVPYGSSSVGSTAGNPAVPPPGMQPLPFQPAAGNVTPGPVPYGSSSISPTAGNNPAVHHFLGSCPVVPPGMQPQSFQAPAGGAAFTFRMPLLFPGADLVQIESTLVENPALTQQVINLPLSYHYHYILLLVLLFQFIVVSRVKTHLFTGCYHVLPFCHLPTASPSGSSLHP